jgi:hypothetical protein
MGIHRVTAVLLLLAPIAATASSPQAWADLDRRVGRACIAVSGLAYPEILTRKISYSDPIGVEVRMLRGKDEKGRFKRLLCAYNRASGRAEVQEAGGWFGPVGKP